MKPIADHFFSKKRAVSRWAAVIFCLLFAGKISVAQSFPVSGNVLSADDRQPLIGASVQEKGTPNGTATDENGLFQLKTASPEAVLVFRFIGFESLEIAVQGRGVVNAELRSEANALQDVVVTGYKKEVRSDIASAISSIKSKNLERLVVAGLDQALQGQAAGVAVTQVTGAPGDDIAVRIRGIG